jgi:hypothetical protein
MPQNPLVTILGPTDGHEENFLKIQKPTQQMSGGWVYAMQKTVYFYLSYFRRKVGFMGNHYREQTFFSKIQYFTSWPNFVTNPFYIFVEK